MTQYDQAFWEQLWEKTLREKAEHTASHPPNAHMVGEVAELTPARALDAGCGHGSDSLWLAARGWQVTAVDFSPSALANARQRAEAMGHGVAERITWVEGDLGVWTPEPAHFQLVVSHYVHVAGSVEDMVRRLASGVAPGGTLFLVGHRAASPTEPAAVLVPGQVQVSVDAALAALDPRQWNVLVAEERPRRVVATGVDAVIRARRSS